MKKKNKITTKMSTQQKYLLATYNIDTNPIVHFEKFHKTHFEYQNKYRSKYITSHLEKTNADILHLQELRKATISDSFMDSLSPIEEWLKKNGYVSCIGNYGNSEGTSSFITAFKKNKFSLLENKTIEISKDPMTIVKYDYEAFLKNDEKYITKMKDHYYGNVFPKSFFMTKLKCLKTGKKILSFNVHMGLIRESRLQGSRILKEVLNENLKKDPKLAVFIGGDFNSFSDDQGEEQMNIISQYPGLINASSSFVLPDGKKMDEKQSTFFAFPYDFGANGFKLKKTLDEIFSLTKNGKFQEAKELTNKTFEKECSVKGGHLDHILLYGMKKESETVLHVAPIHKPFPKKYSEEELKKYVMKNIDKGPSFASDHQMLMVQVSFE